MKLAFAVCRHVMDGEQPAVYETATPAMAGLACCERCREAGSNQDFRLSLWKEESEGFNLVMARDMQQLHFLQRTR